MATKRELDKMLSKLQGIQRKCFKNGSKVQLEIHPKADDDDYSIGITAYNKDKTHQFDTDENGNPKFCDFEYYALYSFYSDERNSAIVKQVMDFLDLTEDEQL